MLRMAEPSSSKVVGAISWMLWYTAWYKTIRQAAHSVFGLSNTMSTYSARHLLLRMEFDSSQSDRLTKSLGV